MSEKNERPSWDNYFMQIATVVASRSTCDRKHVGAVIVRDKQILSTGYNGSPRGMPHCDDVGHELKNMGGRDSCVRTIHAEVNAIAQAAMNGVAVDGATIYVTAMPCYDCAKAIINTGIKKILFGEFYGSRYDMSGKMEKFLAAAGINMSAAVPPAAPKSLGRITFTGGSLAGRTATVTSASTFILDPVPVSAK